VSLQYIRDYYSVPAKRHGRVVVDGKPGVITGANDAHLRVRFDGDTHDGSAHPTWRVTYLDADGSAMWSHTEGANP
jgi:hypothetical protein